MLVDMGFSVWGDETFWNEIVGDNDKTLKY